MKTLSVFLAALIGISCFAQVFETKKYLQYYKTWAKNKTQANYDVLKNYRNKAQFGKNDSDNSFKLAYVILDSQKSYNTINEIIADMDKTCKINDPVHRIQALGTIVSSIANNSLKKQFADNDEYMSKIWYVTHNRICIQLASSYLKSKDYANAIKYAEKARKLTAIKASLLIQAYKLNGQKDKAFEVSQRLFLENRIDDPKKAMELLAKTMQSIPENYPDEKLADFFLKLGKKYPAPGANFEEWKGFMGYIGYRYKQITGKDLFSGATK